MDVVGGGEELEVLLDDHVVVGAHEVGDVTHDGADLAILIADDLAVDPGLSPCGLEKGGENLNRGGLARAVGADEAKAVARLDDEVEVVERGEFAVFLGQVDGFDHRQDRKSVV